MSPATCYFYYYSIQHPSRHGKKEERQFENTKLYKLKQKESLEKGARQLASLEGVYSHPPAKLSAKLN
jgi:hypothetical protein